MRTPHPPTISNLKSAENSSTETRNPSLFGAKSERIGPDLNVPIDEPCCGAHSALLCCALGPAVLLTRPCSTLLRGSLLSVEMAWPGNDGGFNSATNEFS